MKTLPQRLLIVLLGACLANGIASADTVLESLAAGQIGKVAFKSVDQKTTAGQLNTGKFQLTDSINGDLILPDGAGPFPVMVIAHGSGGVTKSNYTWAEFFMARGIGSFVVDSFKPRGIDATVNDQSQITNPASTGDLLVALRLLTTHPKVDATRIGVIGFSRGGQSAMGTAFETWRANVAGTAKFAVHLPFYGGCSWTANRWDGSPIHVFMGDADDYIQPVSTCEVFLQALDKAGVKHSLNVYPGAHHSFDNLDLQKDVYLPRSQAFHKCSYILNVESQVVHAPAKSDQTRPASDMPQITASCWSTGSTIGPNSKATDASRARVAQILEETILKQ